MRDHCHSRSPRHELRRFAHRLFGHGPRGERDGGREGHRHEHRGGRFRLARLFEHGDLRLVILQLIAEKPRHGYDIIKAIEDLAGGAYSPSPGVVYPTLTLLEELGQVTVSTGEGARKLHSITPAGTDHLAANRAALDAILARVAEVAPAGGPPQPVIRAMENLKLALRMRLSRGGLEPEQVQAIAAALDGAVAAIERS